MSVMNFAQDPTTPQATQNLLEQIASESTLYWYALYDSAFVPALVDPARGRQLLQLDRDV